jgi:hypothetical protein
MDCCAVVEGMVFVKDVDRQPGSDKVHNATVVRSHERRRWRLSGSGRRKLRSPGVRSWGIVV